MHGERRHAVVIGASFAGLLAARVLSNHYAHVTLIEKDRVQGVEDVRPGQAQTRHLHGLLARGLDILEEFFPGLTNELIANGAIYDDMGAAICWYQYGGYRRQFESGLKGVVQSRALLEKLIRKRCLARQNVQLADETAVQAWTVENGAITGLSINTSGSPRVLPADLVVDCTGRGSLTPKWLETSGFSPPQKQEIKVGVGYSTRIYHRKSDSINGARMFMSLPSPPQVLRSGYLFPIEGQKWMMTVAGWGGDYPPSDDEALDTFVKSLPIPHIHQVIANATPCSEIMTYRFKSSQRYAYHKLRSMPAGLVVLGDALASFNPVYAQGMTSAAMQAQALDQCLQSTAGDWQRSYYQEAAKIVNIPWQLAAGEDFRFKTTRGKRPPGTQLINKYVTLVHKATHRDTRVYTEFLKVMNLMQPTYNLIKPSVACRVFFPR